MKFELQHTDKNSKARTGILHTDHGEVQTPIFMPVGTAGSVKAVKQSELESIIKAQIILGNTYHLYLRPGTAVIESAGGLHRFINWYKPILTDSGGYQVFSLSERRKISEEGAVFRSHIDGSKHLFSPETVMKIQRSLGSDIMMAFDECPPYPCEKKYAKDSMNLTHRWLKRCSDYIKNSPPLYEHNQTLFPICQGSVFSDLRKQSALHVSEFADIGVAIGGLSVGEPDEEMYEMVDLSTSNIPEEKARYLMGVGTPVNILENIALGVDMFDCVMPTRNARNGQLFTWEGILNMRNKKWELDHSPLNSHSTLEIHQFKRSYIRHLFVAKEILAMQIATINNLVFFLELVQTARKKINEGTFVEWKNKMVPILSQKI